MYGSHFYSKYLQKFINATLDCKIHKRDGALKMERKFNINNAVC